MKIVIDAFGGDNSPTEILKGTFDALSEIKDLNVALVGNVDVLKKMTFDFDFDASRVEYIDAPEVITNEESPVEAIRKKTNSTIVVGLKHLSSHQDFDAFISAGSTGAVLTGGVLLLKRIKGVMRPALAPVLPAENGNSVILIDCGANVECRPEMLVQFAKMGAVYACSIHNVKHPKIGLLSNGAEATKGTDFILQTHELLRANKTINFIGNIEGRDIFNGNCDVVVSDGFTGNIALKSCEGTAQFIFSVLKKEIMKGGLRAKIGYLMLKPVFRKLKTTADYNKKGGAVLIGLNKLVIKVHGSCKSDSFKASIHQAANYIREDLVKKLEESMSSI